MDMILVAFDKDDSLVAGIAQKLVKQIMVPRVDQFADGEIRISFEDHSLFAGKKAVIIQSTCSPVHEHLLRVAFLAHELKNAGATHVVGVIPYFGYARQEKSDIAGKPGPVAFIAKLLESSGIDQIITVDLHAPEIKKFFFIPVHNVTIANAIAVHITQTGFELLSICLVAPDKGAEEYVRAVAEQLGIGVLVFAKERYDVNKTRVIGLTGECRGKTAIIIDDIIDTGGTAINVCNELASLGFEAIHGYFVHPVFSGNALQRIAASNFKTLFVSNTIPLPVDLHGSHVEQFDLSDELATVIKEVV